MECPNVPHMPPQERVEARTGQTGGHPGDRESESFQTLMQMLSDAVKRLLSLTRPRRLTTTAFVFLSGSAGTEGIEARDRLYPRGADRSSPVHKQHIHGNADQNAPYQDEADALPRVETTGSQEPDQPSRPDPDPCYPVPGTLDLLHRCSDFIWIECDSCRAAGLRPNYISLSLDRSTGCCPPL